LVASNISFFFRSFFVIHSVSAILIQNSRYITDISRFGVRHQKAQNKL